MLYQSRSESSIKARMSRGAPTMPPATRGEGNVGALPAPRPTPIPLRPNGGIPTLCRSSGLERPKLAERGRDMGDEGCDRMFSRGRPATPVAMGGEEWACGEEGVDRWGIACAPASAAPPPAL